MPYTQDQFENDDLWKIYEATVSGGSGIEAGVTPITGGNTFGVLYKNNGGAIDNSSNLTFNPTSERLTVRRVSSPVATNLDLEYNGSVRLLVANSLILGYVNYETLAGFRGYAGNPTRIRRQSGQDVEIQDNSDSAQWIFENSGDFSEANNGQTINVSNIQGGTPYLNLGQGGQVAQRINGTSTRFQGDITTDQFMYGYASNPLRFKINNTGQGIEFWDYTETNLFWKIQSNGDLEAQSSVELVTAGQTFGESGFVTFAKLGANNNLTGHATSGYGIMLDDSGALTDPTAYPNVTFGLVSTTKGFMPPQMTTAQRTAIGGTEPIIVYDTTLGQFFRRDSVGWAAF